MAKTDKTSVAIIGGGPSALFMYKRLIESEGKNYDIHIFEKKKKLGAGMPYSDEGACKEHITNVSDNEIPNIVFPIEGWINREPSTADEYNINGKNFNQYKVLPRLLFGAYLKSQFDLLIKKATSKNIITTLHLSVQVKDLIYKKELNQATVITDKQKINFDILIICIGHTWPKKLEGVIPSFYDSPYPPSKLKIQINHPIAIRGSSLTAIDAIRTLARQNGFFVNDENGKSVYHLSKGSEKFKIVMHSRNGLLPAVRFHLTDSHLRNNSLLTAQQIKDHRDTNNGFLSLDFIFKNDFKDLFKDKRPQFYEFIKELTMEEFVEKTMALREDIDAFQLLKVEYLEAENSIEERNSIYWKELLGVLSFAMNQSAKYFSAEDMLRLQKHLMPLISIVIAYVPQSSCEDLMALHDADILQLIEVGESSEIEPVNQGGIHYVYENKKGIIDKIYYKTFIDCVGQIAVAYEDFPFRSFLKNKTISQALIKFQSTEKGIAEMRNNPDKIQVINKEYYLKVSGVTITDNFQLVDEHGVSNDRVYLMSVPYISGYNPDYSGLDFCEAASEKIMESINLRDF